MKGVNEKHCVLPPIFVQPCGNFSSTVLIDGCADFCGLIFSSFVPFKEFWQFSKGGAQTN